MQTKRIDNEVESENPSRTFIALVEVERGGGANGFDWLTFDAIAESSVAEFVRDLSGVKITKEDDGLLLLRVRADALPKKEQRIAASEPRWVELRVRSSPKDSTRAEVVLFGAADEESQPPIVGLEIVGPAPDKYVSLLKPFSTLERYHRAPTTLISAALDIALQYVEPSEIWAAAYDVGQGNCNAIIDRNQHPLVFFDLGWPPNFHSKTRPAAQPNFFACDGGLRAPVVLSHWDMDHWCYAIENSKFKRGSLTTSHQWKKDALTRFWIARAPLEVKNAIGPLAMAFYSALSDTQIMHGVTAILLWPEGVETIPFRFGWLEACKPGVDVPDDSNNTGLAMFIRPSPESPSILLTGDADFQSIPSLSGNIELAGMVAPHHGAFVSDTHAPLPQAGSPARLVISVGLENEYGHPTEAAIKAYSAKGWVMSSTLDRNDCSCCVPSFAAHSHGSSLIPFGKSPDPKCECTCVPTGKLCLLPSVGPFTPPVAGEKPPKKAKAKPKARAKTKTKSKPLTTAVV